MQQITKRHTMCYNVRLVLSCAYIIFFQTRPSNKRYIDPKVTISLFLLILEAILCYYALVNCK